MGGRAERLHPLLSAIPRFAPPPPHTHTHPLSLLSALGDLSGMQQAAPQASQARKQGRPPGSCRLIQVNISFRVCVCAVMTLTSSSCSASASVKRRKGTIQACGGCRNARPRRRKFSRRISRNRCGPARFFRFRNIQNPRYCRSEIFRIRKLVIRTFRIRKIYLILKYFFCRHVPSDLPRRGTVDTA